MRRPSLSCLFLALVATACDRVTAPRALEIADDAERTLWQTWTIHSLSGAHAELNAIIIRVASGDGSSMLVSVDGTQESIGAVVVERVYIPPHGQGMPYSRRSLVAFPQNTSYGILALTETNADDRRGLDDNQSSDDLNPHPALAVAHAREEDWWIPRSGKVVIEPRETGANCPFALGGDDVAADSAGRVSCNLSTFDVQLDGELVKRLDAQNSLLPEALKQHHRLSIASQRVKGIRFTIRCPNDVTGTLGRSWYGIACLSDFSFWRSNDLFARSLGVDIAQMRPWSGPHSSQGYYRTVRAGSERPADARRMLRWTLSYPDGSQIARDSTLDFPDVPESAHKSWLAQDCARGLLDGERRQCLVDLGYDPKGLQRYRVGVMDMEIGPAEARP
jgi:hypothetical protein